MKEESDEIVLHRVAEDVGRKQIYHRPKTMRSLVSTLLARRGYAQENSADRCREVWRSAVGERIARASLPGKIRKGVLTVIVENSVVVQELSMQRQAILKHMGKEAPELKVVGLKFRVGAVK